MNEEVNEEVNTQITEASFMKSNKDDASNDASFPFPGKQEEDCSSRQIIAGPDPFKRHHQDDGHENVQEQNKGKGNRMEKIKRDKRKESEGK